MGNDELELRRSLVTTCQDPRFRALSKGTSGNVSARTKDGFLITPTGVAYDALTPDMVAKMHWDGTIEGTWKPSSEWRFHRDLLQGRPDLNAVVHTHSLHATAVSILGHSIPAIHYRIAATGGNVIKCAPYATFGSQELAALAVAAVGRGRACLLAHHGVIAAHASLAAALNVAEVVEELAALYLLCLPMGKPPILSEREIGTVLEKYKTYGQPLTSTVAPSNG